MRIVYSIISSGYNMALRVLTDLSLKGVKHLSGINQLIAQRAMLKLT